MSTSSATEPTPTTIEIESIVRQVLERLRSGTIELLPSGEAAIKDRVVTLKSIEGLCHSIRRVVLTPKAVVTPAAKDECRRRGIQIGRNVISSKSVGSTSKPNLLDLSIDEDASGDRKRSLVHQLSHRGIPAGCGADRHVHITAKPASTCCDYACAGRTSVAISRLSDIDRFHAELDPEVYVIDAFHMNFMQQLNACIRIAGLKRNGGPL